MVAFRNTPYTYSGTVTYTPRWTIPILGFTVLYNVTIDTRNNGRGAGSIIMKSDVRWITKPLTYTLEFTTYRVMGSIFTVLAAATLLSSALAIKGAHLMCRALHSVGSH